MTTTDSTDTMPDPTPPPDTRRLRRTRTGRVGAGVAGGLGEYFRLDPVLFRVLFATSAFFGGAGILAYLLAWAAIPDEGTERAPIDGWVAELRRRRVPVWLVVVVAGLVLWGVAFSWWLPGPFFPAAVLAVVLIAFHGRRQWQAGGAAPTQAPAVNLAKTSPAGARPPSALHGAARPGWVDDAVAWMRESHAASVERRRRARPVQLSTVLVLAVTLAGLGLVDSVTGIAVPLYFWASLAIIGTGLLVGALARRFPLALTWLILPSIAGVLAFGGSHASLQDGIGERTWTPTTSPAGQYRLALGRGTLDLRELSDQAGPRTIRITAGAGQVRVLVPADANVRIEANIHVGQLTVDGDEGGSGNRGISVRRTVLPPAGATGTPITVDVHLADGQIAVQRG